MAICLVTEPRRHPWDEPTPGGARSPQSVHSSDDACSVDGCGSLSSSSGCGSHAFPAGSVFAAVPGLVVGAVVRVKTQLGSLVFQGTVVDEDTTRGALVIQTSHFHRRLNVERWNVKELVVLDATAAAGGCTSGGNSPQHSVCSDDDTRSMRTESLSDVPDEFFAPDCFAMDGPVIGSPHSTISTHAASGEGSAVVRHAATLPSLERPISKKTLKKLMPADYKIPEPCKYFSTKKGCSRGNSCRYLHVAPEDLPLALHSPTPMLMSPEATPRTIPHPDMPTW